MSDQPVCSATGLPGPCPDCNLTGTPDPVACRFDDCPMTALACTRHRSDPQVGDEVVLRGVVTQRATDPLGRDIVQVTRGGDVYWFAAAEHAEPVHREDPALDLYDVCSHCGDPIEQDAPSGVWLHVLPHDAGRLIRCDTAKSGKPYGLDATP